MIDRANPANDTGVLDTFETWFNENGAGVKMGTFSGSGTSWDDRDYFTWGNVAAGSKQTATGQSVDVSTNDLLGTYCSSGNIKFEYSGGAGFLYYTGDKFGTGSATYTVYDADAVISIYATGDTGGGVIHHLCSLGVGK
jgi:hypothetical protein